MNDVTSKPEVASSRVTHEELMNHPRLKRVLAAKKGKYPEERKHFGGFWREIKRKFVWNQHFDVFRGFRKPRKFEEDPHDDGGVRIEVVPPPEVSANQKAGSKEPMKRTRIKKRKFVWGEPP